MRGSSERVEKFVTKIQELLNTHEVPTRCTCEYYVSTVLSTKCSSIEYLYISETWAEVSPWDCSTATAGYSQVNPFSYYMYSVKPVHHRRVSEPPTPQTLLHLDHPILAGGPNSAEFRPNMSLIRLNYNEKHIRAASPPRAPTSYKLKIQTQIFTVIYVRINIYKYIYFIIYINIYVCILVYTYIYKLYLKWPFYTKSCVHCYNQWF